MQPLWLYLHFPQLQLDSLLAQQAEAQQKRGIIIVDEVDMQVLQLDTCAAEAGIKTGMSLGAAAALMRELDVLPYQPRVEQDKLVDIADRLYLVTSDICFFGQSGLLLRIHNMLHLYTSLQAYWLAIQHQLAVLQLTYHYATGTTPLAAKALAISGKNLISTDIKQLKKQLLSTPLHFSEIEHKNTQKLIRVGVRSIGELLKIPLTDIAKRFAQDVCLYLGRLHGDLPHPVSFYHPESHFERYLELLYEITDTQKLHPPLMHLLHALEQFLKLRDQITQSIRLFLHQRDKQALTLEVGSQQGEYQAAKWSRLTQLKLENVQLLAPIFAITLTADNAYIRQPDKADLFAAKRGELNRLQLVSLLQAKLGKQAVVSPALVNDYRPEKLSVTSAPLAEQTSSAKLQAMRPFFLLNTPQLLTEKVAIQHGPERIQTGWWDGQAIQRDYFVARSQQGQWLWIFRTPQQDWYLHGVFS